LGWYNVAKESGEYEPVTEKGWNMNDIIGQIDDVMTLRRMPALSD